jgi:predicted enzyme related to lactoylglutathione lyase
MSSHPHCAQRETHATRPRWAVAWRHACIAGAPCLASAAGSAAEAQALSPLVFPPSGEHRVGKFVFAELVTPDLAASKRFYGGLLGWTFRDLKVGDRDYAEASLDGVAVAGLAQRPLRTGQARQPAWLSLMAVADVDAARKTALAQGARVLVEPHDRPGRGRSAVFADPQGAVFGVLASSSGDPPEELAAAGEWIWHSLFTPDRDAAAAFYQNLFDYEVFASPQADTTQGAAMQTILASGGYARASANGLPAEGTHSHPHWLGYVRVADAVQAAARAVALGGRVLVTPRADRHGGQLAVVADPQGAPLGLLEWPETVNTKVAP